MENVKKLKYEEPKLDVLVFSTQDIITTSGNGFEGDEDSFIDAQELGVW